MLGAVVCVLFVTAFFTAYLVGLSLVYARSVALGLALGTVASRAGVRLRLAPHTLRLAVSRFGFGYGGDGLGTGKLELGNLELGELRLGIVAHRLRSRFGGLGYAA